LSCTRRARTRARARLLARPAGLHVVRRTLFAAAVVAAIVVPAVAAAYTPSDPLAPKQYYLAQDRAFDAFGDTLPPLSPVRVAVIDSGIDATHPEFKGKILTGKSF